MEELEILMEKLRKYFERVGTYTVRGKMYVFCQNISTNLDIIICKDTIEICENVILNINVSKLMLETMNCLKNVKVV